MADADLGPPHVDLGGYVLGALGDAERADFERHLAGCERCRRELDELRGMPGLLAQAAEPVEVPAGLESRVMGLIAREPPRGGERARAAGLPAPRRARSRWPSAWALGAAAAVAIALLGGLGLGR